MSFHEPTEAARQDYALDRDDPAGPVPSIEARRRAEARRQDGRPIVALYWDEYARLAEADGW